MVKRKEKKNFFENSNCFRGINKKLVLKNMFLKLKNNNNTLKKKKKILKI